MNKLPLIVLLVILAALVVFLLVRKDVDTRPDLPGERGTTTPSFAAEIGGVPTDEPGDFHVDVEARTAGARAMLEFTVTESHGWGARGVYISFWHRIKNEETGEWEPDPDFDRVTFLCKEPVRIGEPLVYETTLTSVEMGQLRGELGDSEEWAAEIDQTMEVRKPE